MTEAEKAANRVMWHRNKANTNANRAAKARMLNPAMRPYKPQAPQGPSAGPPPLQAGHELSGVSTLTGPNGETKAEWNKTRIAGGEPMPLPEGFDLPPVSVSRMTRGDGSQIIEWQRYKADEKQRADAVAAAIKAFVAENVTPIAPAERPAVVAADLLNVFPIGDPHIGMLAWANEVGEHFDTRIAERELCECMRQLVARSPAASSAIVTNLGDFFHAQDDNRRTPKSGNPLDVDGRSGKVGRVGLQIVSTIIDAALTKHDHVKFRSLPGNHDPHSSFWITEVMRERYRNEPRVTIEDSFNPYQFDVFGANLLGWAHGDGAKIEALSEIMSVDAAEFWAAEQFRFWHTGHVHHLTERELRGCVVYTHRTLAGRDAWHHHSGYRSGRSLKSMTYHKRFGLDGVAVVGVERVRAALLNRKAA
jgi:hypothetical protein